MISPPPHAESSFAAIDPGAVTLILAAARRLGLRADQIASAPVLSRLPSNVPRGGTAVPPERADAGEIADVTSVTRMLDGRRRAAAARELGIGWTPPAIVDAILDDVRSHAPARGALIDPCCGSGVFAVRLVESAAARGGSRAARAVVRRLYAIDVDPVAALQTHALLEIVLLRAGLDPAVDVPNVRAGDFLDDASWQDDAYRALGGAAAVFGNPPYVRLQDLPEHVRAQLVAMYGDLLHGSFSLSQAFLAHGIASLRPGGVLGFVTQNNFPTSKSAAPIRDWLQRNGYMRRYVDLGYARHFAGQGAYACLLFAGAQRRDAFDYARVDAPEAIASAAFSPIDVAALDPSKWRLAAPAHLAQLRALETTGVPLGEFAEIRVGFATLADRVFLLERLDGDVYRAADGTVFAAGELAGIARAASRVSALPARTFAVIFPYAQRDGRCEVIAEDALRRDHPPVYRYLLRHREKLLARDKARPPAEGWYAWSRRQGMTSPGPKWLTKTFDKRPNFVLIGDDRLFCNGYSVRPRERWAGVPAAQPAVFDRLLNSAAMGRHAQLAGFQIAGGYQCFQKNFIERFAIPPLDARAATAIAAAASQAEADPLIFAAFGLDAAGAMRQPRRSPPLA